MARRPRVRADAIREHDEIISPSGVVASHGLSVRIEVDFALHDHQRALSSLEAAVADIKSQIAEVDKND